MTLNTLLLLLLLLLLFVPAGLQQQPVACLSWSRLPTNCPARLPRCRHRLQALRGCWRLSRHAQQLLLQRHAAYR
jgi:hypothetical protein